MDNSNHVPGRHDTSGNQAYQNDEPYNQFFASEQGQEFVSGWGLENNYDLNDSSYQFFSPSSNQNDHSYSQQQFPPDSTAPPSFGHYGHTFPQHAQSSIDPRAFAGHQQYAPDPRYSARPSASHVSSFQQPNIHGLSHDQPAFTSAQTVSPHAIYKDLDGAHGVANEVSRERETNQVPALPVKTKSPVTPTFDIAVTPPSSLPPISQIPSPPPGIHVGSFLVQDRQKALDQTNSQPIPRALFVFKGKDAFDVSATKAVVPRFNRRKSRNEVRELMLNKDPQFWSPLQRWLAKKLRQSAHKATRPSATAADRGTASREEDSSSDSSSDSDDESDSEYDSSDEEESDVEEPSPLSASRPTEPKEAVRYDTIKSMWRPSNRPLAGSEIREALLEYWNVVKAVRDKWTAAEKGEPGESTKVHSVKQRDLLTTSVATVIEMGHKDIVEKLGENLALMSLLCKILRDYIKDDQINDKSVVDVLELLSRCVTISESTLEQLKFSKLQARLAKKGDDNVKTLLKKISENASLESKGRSEEAKSGKEFAKQPESLSVRPKTMQDSAVGVKRGRPEADSGSDQAAKRPMSASVANGKAISPQERRPSASSAPAKPAASTAPASAAVKPKTTTMAAKPTGFFAGLQSASKRKPTAATTKPALASASNDKTATSTASNGARPAFSLSATLASLNKPKEPEEKTPETEKAPPETAEERKKRLRKEQRRKLRVNFKPEDALVEVRYFTHDQAEEIGRADNLVRDAGDAMEEGRMFKQHRDVDMMDEEEEPQESEQDFRPYPALKDIDFDMIEEAERARNAITRGGLVDVDSPEAKAQDQREANTLMIVYTSLVDIPPSPREPAEEDESDFNPELLFGPPPDWMRERERKAIARMQPPKPAAPPPPAAQNNTSTPDISSLLRALGGKQQPQMQQNQQNGGGNPLTDLEKIFAMHSGGQTGQPSQQTPSFGQPSQNQSPDIQALLAGLAQEQGFNQPQQQQQAPPAPPLHNSQSAQLESVLAQLAGGGGGGQNQGANNFPPMPSQYGGAPPWASNDGARDRESSRSGDYGYEDRRTRDNKRKRKTVQCKFFGEGRCRKGADCPFLHGNE